MTRWKFSFQNLTRNKISISEWCFLKSMNFEKHVVFTEQKEPKRDFVNAILFQYPTFRKIFNSESNAAYFFQSKIWRVGKLLYQNVTCYKVLFQNLTSCETFFPQSVSYLVVQLLTEWWFLLSMLTTTYLKDEKSKTVSGKHLFVTCATRSCHESIRLSACEE